MAISGASTHYSDTSRYSVTSIFGSAGETGSSSAFASEIPGTQAGTATGEPSGNDTDTALETPNADFQRRLTGLTWRAGAELAVAKPLWERLSSEDYAEYQETQRGFLEMQTRVLEHDYTHRPDDPNDPRIKPYANITIGGKVVVTIDNQGCVGTMNDGLAKRLAKLSEETNGLEGPALAKYLSEKIGEMLGGKVVVAGTAITQSVYERLVEAAQPTIDFEGMKNDPRYAEIQKQYDELARNDVERSKYLDSL